MEMEIKRIAAAAADVAPTTKQDAGAIGLGAAIGILIVYVLGTLGVDVPAEPSVAIGTVTTFITSRIFK